MCGCAFNKKGEIKVLARILQCACVRAAVQARGVLLEGRDRKNEKWRMAISEIEIRWVRREKETVDVNKTFFGPSLNMHEIKFHFILLAFQESQPRIRPLQMLWGTNKLHDFFFVYLVYYVQYYSRYFYLIVIFYIRNVKKGIQSAFFLMLA